MIRFNTVMETLIKHFTLLRMLFYRDIKKGDEFIFNASEEKNPFKKEPFRVRVKAVKNGFVNYEFIGSSLWTNESMGIVNFNFCYIPDVRG